jgi:hypothetical protein
VRFVGLAMLAGCALGIDTGVLQRQPADLKGASAGLHMGFGGGGMTTNRYALGVQIDTRVDVASDGSRWTGGSSVLGGVNLGGVYLDGRAGVWRAIVSGASEASIVPTLELGVFVPLTEHYDPKHPQYGENAAGFVAGVREDFDRSSYFTVFVGYAIFLIPGY